MVLGWHLSGLPHGPTGLRILQRTTTEVKGHCRHILLHRRITCCHKGDHCCCWPGWLGRRSLCQLSPPVTLVAPFPYIPLEDSRYGTCIFVLQRECGDVLSRGVYCSGFMWYYVYISIYREWLLWITLVPCKSHKTQRLMSEIICVCVYVKRSELHARKTY